MNPIEELKKKWEKESDKLYPARPYAGMEIIDMIRDDLTILNRDNVVIPRKGLEDRIEILKEKRKKYRGGVRRRYYKTRIRIYSSLLHYNGLRPHDEKLGQGGSGGRTRQKPQDSRPMSSRVQKSGSAATPEKKELIK